MTKKIDDIKQIKWACNKCNKEMVWPIEGWSINIVGLLQVQCGNCGQILSFPDDAVWGLRENQDAENMAVRLLSQFDDNRDD